MRKNKPEDKYNDKSCILPYNYLQQRMENNNEGGIFLGDYEKEKSKIAVNSEVLYGGENVFCNSRNRIAFYDAVKLTDAADFPIYH